MAQLSTTSRTGPAETTARPLGPDIFKDIGSLYGLRSRLVHGGSLKLKDAKGAVAKLSTSYEGMFPEEDVAQGVDRLRDLVRRAILARIILGSGGAPLWPLSGDSSIDAVLADADERERWRREFQAGLAKIRAKSAADRARVAVSSLSRDDR